MQKQARYIGGIAGVLGFFYFLIDLQKKWISSILFFGWTSESGEFNEGVLGADSLSIFWMVNFVGLGVSAWFITEHLYKEKKLDFLVEAFTSGKQQISTLYFNLKSVQFKPVKLNISLPEIKKRTKNKTNKSFSKQFNIIGISVATVLAISATIFILNEYSKYNQLSKSEYGKNYSELNDTEKVYIEILSEKNNNKKLLKPDRQVLTKEPIILSTLPTTEVKNELIISGDDIWIRNEPSTGEVVMNLNNGDRCTMLSKCCFEKIRGLGDYWYQIQHMGKQGWVFGAQTNLMLSEQDKEEIDCNNCHLVQAGESLYSISEIYSLSLKELNELNPQLENGWISEGMQLFVVKPQDEYESGVIQNSFFIVSTAAVKDQDVAKEMVEDLILIGYEADYLWIPDYKSLSGKEYFAIFIGPFLTPEECANFVESYREKVPTAYGQLVSNDERRIEIRGIGKIKSIKKNDN